MFTIILIPICMLAMGMLFVSAQRHLAASSSNDGVSTLSLRHVIFGLAKHAISKPDHSESLSKKHLFHANAQFFMAWLIAIFMTHRLVSWLHMPSILHAILTFMASIYLVMWAWKVSNALWSRERKRPLDI
ncbi:hypothetical protein ACI2KR_27285 [Pseudomonas luteola]